MVGRVNLKIEYSDDWEDETGWEKGRCDGSRYIIVHYKKEPYIMRHEDYNRIAKLSGGREITLPTKIYRLFASRKFTVLENGQERKLDNVEAEEINDEALIEKIVKLQELEMFEQGLIFDEDETFTSRREEGFIIEDHPFKDPDQNRGFNFSI